MLRYNNQPAITCCCGGTYGSLIERKTRLRRIGKAIGRSDPRLNSMLAAFSGFNAGETKPRWEQLRMTPMRMLAAIRPGVSAMRAH